MATDPECLHGSDPAPGRAAVGEHCEQSSPVGRRETAGRPSLRAGTAGVIVPRSGGGPTSQAVTLRAEQEATFHGTLVTAAEPVVALHSAESAPTGRSRRRARVREDPAAPPRHASKG